MSATSKTYLGTAAFSPKNFKVPTSALLAGKVRQNHTKLTCIFFFFQQNQHL